MLSRRMLLRLAAGGLTGLAVQSIVRAQARNIIWLPMVVQQPTPTALPSPTNTPPLWPSPTVPPPTPLPSPTSGVPTPIPADDAPIVAPASGSVEQGIAWFVARSNSYTPTDINEIVNAYRSYGDACGVDWFLALAQCSHETGGLTSWWCRRPRRNPAGIGVTGKTLPGSPDSPPGPDWAWDGTQWQEGISFATWANHAVPAQLGRLLAYALRDEAATPYQRELIVYALNYRPLPERLRGIAPTIVGLNGRWAYPGTTYGQAIVDVARRMRGG